MSKTTVVKTTNILKKVYSRNTSEQSLNPLTKHTAPNQEYTHE
jgi:hypothetical protein